MFSESGRIPLWLVATVAGLGVLSIVSSFLLRCLCRFGFFDVRRIKQILGFKPPGQKGGFNYAKFVALHQG
jgi:photosystem II PsbJ protein